MPSYAQIITDFLLSDAEYSALMTGGIWNYAEMGRKGLNRIQQLEAFSSKTGLIKPLTIVIQLNEQPNFPNVDLSNGWMATITPILCWIYQDGNDGYDIVSAAFDRMYSLLQGKRFLNPTFRLILQNTIKDKREPDLKEASYWRVDWKAFGHRSGSSS